jgi:glucose/arabinose dehydrogenase
MRVCQVVVVLVLAAACGELDATVSPITGPEPSEVLVAGVNAVTLAPTDDGGLLWADREAGTVRTLTGELVAEVSVLSDGQRGLLGLAVHQERVFLSWTDPDGVLRVGEAVNGEVTAVWDGPASSNGANGGRLAVTEDGGVVIGIGTLQNSSRVSDPTAPNGKLLLLDPNGPADQTPVVLSSGWNNPFSFAITPAGELWVADNHPTDGEERLGRGDLGLDVEVPVAVLPADSAPSGLAAVASDELWVCSYLTGAIYRYRIEEDGGVRSGTVANDCRFDVASLSDGRVVYSTNDDIRVLRPPQ